MLFLDNAKMKTAGKKTTPLWEVFNLPIIDQKLDCANPSLWTLQDILVNVAFDMEKLSPPQMNKK